MSKLNHERPIFKILKDFKSSDNTIPDLQSEVSFEIEYPCDGSAESWLSYKHLFPYLFPPTQHAVIFGDFSTFPKQSRRLPEGVNPNSFLLLCNVLFENRKFIKKKEKVIFSKTPVSSKMRWDFSSLQGLYMAICHANNNLDFNILIKEEFLVKFRKIEERNSNRLNKE